MVIAHAGQDPAGAAELHTTDPQAFAQDRVRTAKALKYLKRSRVHGEGARASGAVFARINDNRRPPYRLQRDGGREPRGPGADDDGVMTSSHGEFLP
ncbi:hypothetical protein GCM10027449_16420 [Sinomonas notoginsengisoli]